MASDRPGSDGRPSSTTRATCSDTPDLTTAAGKVCYLSLRTSLASPHDPDSLVTSRGFVVSGQMPDRLDLLGVGAGNPAAGRADREATRPAGLGGPMLTDIDTARLTRCDRCGAEAKVRREFEAGELLLCDHHAREA